MNWNTLSQIATTLSTIIGAASLIAVYRVYYSSKKDESIKNIRITLSKITSNCKRLNYLATHQLLHEISYSVIYRDDIKDMITNLLKEYKRTDSESLINEDSLKKFINENIPTITVPVSSELTKEYSTIIQETQIEIEKYRFSLPGLYKVIDSVMLVFHSLLEVNIRTVSNDDIWESLLFQFLSDEKQDKDMETIHSKMHEFMTAMLMYRFNEQKDQLDIDDMLQIIEIVINPYLGLKDNDLYNQTKNECKIHLIPNKELNGFKEYFKEAEKALKTILTQNDLLEYRTRVTAYAERIKIQNEK